ncbi:Alpha/beta hydrolase fold-3 [Penicillium sp. CMV-2018d]|nr:Alpha/beta hydrolase fold-3 [Penicillium sp. CMV-2018d]
MAPLLLGLGIGVVKSFVIATWTAIIAPFRGQKGGARYSFQAYYAVFCPRPLSICIHGADLTCSYSRFCSEKLRGHMSHQKASPNIIVLAEGTTAFWLGNPAAEKLIIYFHGGAYCLPALPNHLTHLEALPAT